jgi:hypothetical protein
MGKQKKIRSDFGVMVVRICRNAISFGAFSSRGGYRDNPVGWILNSIPVLALT